MSSEAEKHLNELAGEIVMMDAPEIADLKALMGIVDKVQDPRIAVAVTRFKTFLLDLATGAATPGSGDVMSLIRKEFDLLQKDWEEARRAPLAECASPATGPVAAQRQAGPIASAPPDATLDDDPELLMGFIQESGEHLDSIEVNILEWEANPDDKEIVNSIFRPFHTIKGMAGFLNLNQIQGLSHELENLLDAARDGKLKFSRALAELILFGVDALRELMKNLAERLENKPPSPLSYDLQSMISRVKGMLSSPPPPPAVPRVGAILVHEKSAKPAEVIDALTRQSAGDPRPVGDILVEDKVIPREDLENALNIQARKERDVSQGKYLKVDTLKMDALFDLVGELVITNNMLIQNKAIQEHLDRRANSDFAQLKRITSSLQNISLSMRMVPIGTTFQKMRRVVYDLAQKSGKKINLRLAGESTEIDRNLVESLYDPLLHMVRNASDHGVETPEKRRAAGKEDAGNVSLEAYQKGGHIFIEIRDDGGGIDPQKVKRKALSKGLITEADELDDHALINMIFRPGFSTVENITDISGRGVGMDVVKKAAAKLGGRVEVQSVVGAGSTFILKFPLTLAIIDGIVVMIGNERYIVPTIHVKEALKVTRQQYNVVAGKGETLLIRDRVYPLIRVHRHFSSVSAIEHPWDAIVILVETESRDVAMQVDEIVGKQEVVIKNLGDSFQSSHGISGGAILGDGRIGLILDVNQLEMAAMGM